MSYSIHLIDEKGQGSYLSVHDRTTWKTKRAAKRHLQDVLTLISKGRFPAVTADLENEFGELIATRPAAAHLRTRPRSSQTSSRSETG